MALSGDLKTMPLVELFQWASMNGKTGLLELERNRVCRRVVFRDGQISACSADDPSLMLGQLLLADGRIGPQTLRYALRQQKGTHQSLPEILVDMGLLSREELDQLIASKAEEIIHGLFEWEEAIFRFRSEIPAVPNEIELDMTAQTILLSGARRHDDLKLIREIFASSGVILRRTDDANDEPPKSVMAVRILELVDGERTLGEVLLHAHAPEFLVLQVLHGLHTDGRVEIVRERAVAPTSLTLLDGGIADAIKVPQESELANPDLADTIAATELPEPAETDRPPELNVLIEAAERLVAANDYEEALVLLDTSYSLRPDDIQVRALVSTVETAYLKQLRDEFLGRQNVPVRLEDVEVPGDIPPSERFLLDLIDGNINVQAMIWTAPLRELDVLVGLKQLTERRLIRLTTKAERDSDLGFPDEAELPLDGELECDTPDAFPLEDELACDTLDEPLNDLSDEPVLADIPVEPLPSESL